MKKLLQAALLIMMMSMLLAVSAFAAEGDIVVPPNFFENGQYKEATLDIEGFADSQISNIYWSVRPNDYFDLDSSTGKITAKKAGSEVVNVRYTYTPAGEAPRDISKEATVTVAPWTITSVDATNTNEYVDGETIPKSDFTVKAVYTDTKTYDISVDNFAIDKEKAAAPESGNKMTIKVTVTGTEAYDTVDVVVTSVDITNMVTDIKIKSPANNAEYEAGTELKASDVKVEITMRVDAAHTNTFTVNLAENKDIIVGGDVAFVNDSYTFLEEFVGKDRTLTVSYGGKSDSITLKVKAKPEETEKPEETPPAQTVTYTIEMSSAPTKKAYKVGDKFDDSGMTVIVWRTSTPVGGGNSMKVNCTNEVSGLTYNEYTIKESDTGKTYIEFEVSFNADGGTHKATLRVTGLTIGVAIDTSRIGEITSVTLKEDKYPEGYEFKLTDIEKMKVKFYGDRTATTIEYDEFAEYEYISSKYMTLEVYDEEGERKTYSTYRDTIRDDDIITESNGDKVVNMALRYTYFTSSSETAKGKDGEYTFKIEIGEADVSYYFDSKLIAEYDDLDDALEFCNEQDDDIDEDDFDISDVDDNDYILLKLGKSFKLSSSFDFTPENNIVIDLNGYNLTLDSDTFEFDKSEDFTITIRNTSKTDSKLTFDDKDIEIVLKEDEKVEFEYGKTLPGIYTVTVSYNADEGTITADPKLSTGKVEVGKGSTVKFTVTPKTDYAVDTVKVGTKSVVTDKDNYSLNSTTGVVTYTLKDISKDTTFSVTFKKVKKEWNNPFRDVSSNAEYYSAVEFVYENELFKGTTNTTFSPSGSMTRATFVTVLGRLSGMDDNEAVRKYGYDSDFTDVSASNSRITYAVPYIKWAVENGIVEGYGDGTCGPEREITHQQMYVMMYRYARFVENKSDSIQYTSLSMSDRSSVADWAVDSVKYAQKNNYLVFTNSTQTKIDPTGVAKRSELAMLLETFCETVLNWSDVDEK